MTTTAVALFPRIEISDAQSLFSKERVGEPEAGCVVRDPAASDAAVNWMSSDQIHDFPEARSRVEACCQSLVDAGAARWWINDAGHTELHMNSGESYLFGKLGITRTR